jgi:hypothetical protein
MRSFETHPGVSAGELDAIKRGILALAGWRCLDWSVEAAGYRLVIEGGAMTGLERLGDPFTCDCCGHAFTKGWSDEEAMAEAESLYPAEDLEAEEPGIVCDPCFQVIMAWAQEEMPGHLLQPYDWAIERTDGG